VDGAGPSQRETTGTTAKNLMYMLSPKKMVEQRELVVEVH
jgi:hypothetical protein